MTRVSVKAAGLLCALLFFAVCDKSSEPTVDKTTLNEAIAGAEERHANAVEGADTGLFKHGSKFRYLRAIYLAKRAQINPFVTQEEIDTAVKRLDIATKAFHKDTIEAGEEIYSGAAVDSVMLKKMTFEHWFTFTLKPNNTFTLLDSVRYLRAHVFLQMGDWQKNNDVCTFTPTLCMTLDVEKMEMVPDTVMAPYSARIEGDTMTIDELGYLGTVSFLKHSENQEDR